MSDAVKGFAKKWVVDEGDKKMLARGVVDLCDVDGWLHG